MVVGICLQMSMQAISTRYRLLTSSYLMRYSLKPPYTIGNFWETCCWKHVAFETGNMLCCPEMKLSSFTSNIFQQHAFGNISSYIWATCCWKYALCCPKCCIVYGGALGNILNLILIQPCIVNTLLISTLNHSSTTGNAQEPNTVRLSVPS